MTKELENIPEDLKITDVFLHVEPLEVAKNPELRRKLIEHYREERRMYVEENTRGKKVKTPKQRKEAEDDILSRKV